MSTPDGQLPAEERPAPAQAETGPTVTTAPPPRAGRRWSRLPTHVGAARTSTIVLAVLFVGIFVLWLYVHPPATAAAGSTGTSPATGQPVSNAPAPTSTPTPTRTTTPTTARTSSPTPSQSTSGSRTSTTSPSSVGTGTPTGTGGGSTSIPSLPTTGSSPTS